MAYYRECDASHPTPAVQVETEHVFYLDKTSGTEGTGLTIESPFNDFDQYRKYVAGHQIVGSIQLVIMDGDYYPTVNFADIIGYQEQLTIYAPFATLGSISFLGEGSTYYEHCKVVAAFVVGNVTMSKNNSLVVDTMGVRSGTTLPSGVRVSTAIDFDGRDDLENITIKAKLFDGDISVNAIKADQHSVTLHLDFVRWSHNNTKMHEMLATLPNNIESTNSVIEICGRVNDVSLPLEPPRFRKIYGSPQSNSDASFPVVFNEYSDLITSHDYLCNYFVEGIDNFITDIGANNTFDLVTISTTGQGGIGTNTADGSVFKIVTPTLQILQNAGVEFSVRLSSDDVSTLGQAPIGVPIVLQASIVLRQYNNRTNVEWNAFLEMIKRQDLTVTQQPIGS